MKLEILLSCMNQKDFSIIDNFNLRSDILIVNQCNENSYREEIRNGFLCRMINTTKRGLSQSRNECLNNMNGDIGIICDDDVKYYDNYTEIILNAFTKLRDADIITFDIDKINSREKSLKKLKIKKAPWYKNYSSVTIAFKKEALKKNNIWFNLNFGSGSKYSSGEESLLLREANRKNMKIYEYPATIAKVDYSHSTWFSGYDENFFYDKGALLKAGYPKSYYILKYYFVLKLRKKTNLSISEMVKNLNNGIKGYENNLSFEEFNKI